MFMKLVLSYWLPWCTSPPPLTAGASVHSDAPDLPVQPVPAAAGRGPAVRAVAADESHASHHRAAAGPARRAGSCLHSTLCWLSGVSGDSHSSV